MLGKKRWRYHQLAVAQNLYLVEQSKAKPKNTIISKEKEDGERSWTTWISRASHVYPKYNYDSFLRVYVCIYTIY